MEATNIMAEAYGQHYERNAVEIRSSRPYTEIGLQLNKIDRRGQYRFRVSLQ